MPTVTTISGELIAVDLNTRDFEGYTSDALEFAQVVAPDWTDRSEADPGVTLVECFAFMADNLSYYQDRCANEALFPSAVQRRSVIEHCKLIGYELRSGVSASVELTFVTNAAGTVPAGTSVEVDTTDGSDPASFELESDFVSTGAGTYTGEIALEGTTVSDEVLGSSDGSAGQSYTLSSYPLALNPSGSSSLVVSVYESTPVPGTFVWTEVDNFLESEPDDRHYRTEVDEFDVVTVFFGDGVNGRIPPSGTNNITATYRVGGGIAGNRVAADKLTKLIGSYPFVDSVTNPEQPSGGRDKESIEEAKDNAPASLKALDRGVNHNDYVALAKEVAGVNRALAYNGNGAYEEIIVIAVEGTNPVPTGSWDPYTEVGSGLIGSVGAYLNERKTTPVILWIYPAQVYDYYLDIQVFLHNDITRASATRLIQDAIIEALDVEALQFGEQVPVSKVYDVVEDISGIDYLNVNRFQRQPYARKLTTASLSDITFDPINVGLTTVRDRWLINWISSTQYTVTGETSGLQSATGTIDVLYTTDDGGLSFKANTVTVSPNVDDKWEIFTGTYVGNMDPDSDELGRLMGGTFALSLVGGQG
jgi:hypothetical protein